MATKKSWAELSPTQQRLIITGAVIEGVLTAIALADLIRRPADCVRGPKPLWALGLFVQPVGPIAYFAVGRRGM